MRTIPSFLLSTVAVVSLSVGSADARTSKVAGLKTAGACNDEY